MKEKIVFAICLLLIFICEYFGLWYYFKRYNGALKKRTAVLVMILLLDLLILCAFAGIYNAFFPIL